MTANDLIASALRLIGVLASGENPTGEEGVDALAILNDMVDSWNAERLMIFTVNRQVFDLTAGKQTYTLGAGGDFNIARPPQIERAGIISLNNPAQPLELPIEVISDQRWAGVPVKNISSALPMEVWDDGGFPLRTLTYWPLPSVAVQTALYIWQALTEFADATVAISLPPAYRKALRYNLAVDLAPEFGVSTPPEVAAQAVIAKAAIRSFNAPAYELKCDEAVVSQDGGFFNYLTGDTVGR